MPPLCSKDLKAIIAKTVFPDEARRLELQVLQAYLDYSFTSPDLLNQALSHSSYVHGHNRKLQDNERLEFLGDAVINLVVSHYSLIRYPTYSEGDLSKLRAAVVNEAHVAKIARQLDLGRFLLLGKGEEQTGGREKDSLLADAFEALMAAVYLDGGFDVVYQLILRYLQPHIDTFPVSRRRRDYKSELQEYTQNRLGCVPHYQVVSASGPDHKKLFEVEILVQGKLLGRGKGSSKKGAEQRAAQVALEAFKERPSTP